MTAKAPTPIPKGAVKPPPPPPPLPPKKGVRTIIIVKEK